MPNPAARPSLTPSADPAIWRALSVFGAVLVSLGLLDLFMLWVPESPDSAQSIFGTISTLFDHFPQVGLGVVLLLAGGIFRGRTSATRWLAILAVMAAAGLWLVGFLYLDALPYILQVSSPPAVHAHVRNMVIKTGVQALVYPILLVLLAFRGWQTTRAGGDA
jgi:hypothetical protein